MCFVFWWWGVLIDCAFNETRIVGQFPHFAYKHKHANENILKTNVLFVSFVSLFFKGVAKKEEKQIRVWWS